MRALRNTLYAHVLKCLKGYFEINEVSRSRGEGGREEHKRGDLYVLGRESSWVGVAVGC